jgi:hypothetical protein
MYDDLNNMLWLRVSIGLASTLLIGIALHIIVPLKCMQIAGALLLSAAMSGMAITITDWLTKQLELGQISLFLLSGTLFCGAYAIMLVILLPRLMGTSVSNLISVYRQAKGEG